MFYKVKNSADNNTSEIYIYGDIVSEKTPDWYGNVSENDIDLKDFKEACENSTAEKINLYINSGGGSVFAASAMVGMLKRAKSKGKKICSYIDGLAASAASWLALAADETYIYKNSMMMVHKPLSIAYGNALDFQKAIDELNQVEKGVMMPIYLEKSKISESELDSMISNETWLTSDEIKEAFNVRQLDEEKQAVATTSAFFVNYKNLPKEFMAFMPTNKTQISENPDLSEFENKLNLLKERKK